MKTCLADAHTRLPLAVSAILLIAAPPLGAQEPDPFGPLAVFQMAERQDWVMRASLSNGDEIVGRVREIDDASARLEGGIVPFRELVVLERGERHRGGIVKGAVVGGAIAGGIAALVLYIAPADDADTDEGDVLAGITVATGIGALIGGAIGAALAPPGTDWVPIWPAHSVDRRR